ncbi:hypothetical protein J0S82_014248, partial [Galemys pyrenaicus]
VPEKKAAVPNPEDEVKKCEEVLSAQLKAKGISAHLPMRAFVWINEAPVLQYGHTLWIIRQKKDAFTEPFSLKPTIIVSLLELGLQLTLLFLLSPSWQ